MQILSKLCILNNETPANSVCCKLEKLQHYFKYSSRVEI